MEKYYNFIIIGLLIAILVIVIENKKSKENLHDACDSGKNISGSGCVQW